METGPKSTGSGCSSSSQASPSRTSISSGTTEPYNMTGWHIICSKPSMKSRDTPRNGYGRTITNARIWPSVALHRNNDWSSWPSLYFWRPLKMGEYRSSPKTRHPSWLRVFALCYRRTFRSRRRSGLFSPRPGLRCWRRLLARSAASAPPHWHGVCARLPWGRHTSPRC